MHWIARLQIVPNSFHRISTASSFPVILMRRNQHLIFQETKQGHASTYLKERDHCVNKSQQCSFTWENYMEVIESPSLKQDSGNWQEKCNCSFSNLNSTENRSFYHLVSASVFPLMWGDTWIEWLCKRGEFMKEHDAMWHLAALAGISSGKRMCV